jgi:hypothetical protein
VERETAWAEYDALVKNIEAVKAQLNGFQSINRNLSEV